MQKKVSKISLLFCPIHSLLLRSNKGSEFAWAYTFFQITSCQDKLNCVYLTGATDIDDQRVVDLHTTTIDADQKTINGDARNSISLAMKSFIWMIKNRFSSLGSRVIYHHFLPCAYQASVNLFLVFFPEKYIIGPVQKPLLCADADLFTVDSKRLKFSIAFALLQHIQKKLSSIFFRKAYKIIAITSETKTYLTQKGLDPHNIVIIPVGIICRDFLPALHTDRHTLKLIAATYLLKRKGLETTLKAIQQVANSVGAPQLHLQIIGTGPQEMALRTLTKELNIEQYISYVGHQDQDKIKAYYQHSHIFINASKDESFGQTCLEALASGLGILSTPVGIFKDAVKKDINGYLFEVDDYLGLAELIIKLLHDKDLKFQLMRESLQIARAYDWENSILPQYLKLYDDTYKSI